ncbi:4-hydroxy-tetrahydrodipicolinate synthase [Amycolatopsis arida]|uniref:4-hydroxy-tetrahydrodipicolinate synthase n=1 Tax=Amycolatopsis arida TaxID=587909 RepID=A0A1I5URE4_9PSEU|nr:dihydrodipicolinate synthase family protein [Amycolatopsis arida]TDX91006.1 4-hydroxy-tetrahydrodipicolinate synthase [Amycolatopsis arida]SFP97780.1 4-hydroxy-tetrahydrodipicolinate synthase [Amycolatopsis arida]
MTADLALHGVVPPLVTPLTATGEVDRASLERLVEFQLAAGVDGVFLGGSSGEVALLDTAQRRAIVEVAVGTVAGAVPVLAGAVDTGTRRVIEHARQAAALGADAVVVTAPFYVRPHPAEIVEHFRLVQAALPCPVVAYDIPGAVGARLVPDLVAELAETKLVVALKDSSGDLATFREIRRRAPDLPALTGSELLADTAVALGAAGIVPGLGNVDPHGYVRLYRAARDGDLATAAAEQDRLARLFGIVDIADRGRIGFTAGALGAFKAALALRGVIDHPATNPPLLPLDRAETGAIRRILTDAGLG